MVFLFLLLAVLSTMGATMCQSNHFFVKNNKEILETRFRFALFCFAYRHRNSTRHLRVHLKFSLYVPILLFILSLLLIIVEVVSCTEQ